MSEPLTDGLRRSLARGAPTLEQCDAVIRLLDELEQLRRRDRAERKIEMLRGENG